MGIKFNPITGDLDLTGSTSGLVTSVTASSPLSSSGGTTPNISLGTVTTANGGTGLTTWTQGDIPYYTSSTALSKLAKSTSSTRYLSNQGASNAPSWSQINLTNGVTGTLPISSGGTGMTDSTLRDGSSNTSIDWLNRILQNSSATTTLNWETYLLIDSSSVTSLDWSNRKLYDTSSSEKISFASGLGFFGATEVSQQTGDILTGLTNLGLFSSATISATGLTGVVPIANGGTNSSGGLSNNRVMRSSGGSIVEAAAITASRALISDGSGIPTHSATTSTELGYVSGVTSAIQTQLNAKQASLTGAISGTANQVTVSANSNSVASNITLSLPQSIATTSDVSFGTVTASKAVHSGVVALSDGASINTDVSLGNTFTVTLGGNRTLKDPVNGVNGQKVTWRIRQDGTGSRTLAFDPSFRFGNSLSSITLTTTANKTDYIGAIYNSTDSKWDVVSFSDSY